MGEGEALDGEDALTAHGTDEKAETYGLLLGHDEGEGAALKR